MTLFNQESIVRLDMFHVASRCFVFLVCAIFIASAGRPGKPRTDSRAVFQAWKQNFKKNYATPEEEDKAMKKVMKNSNDIEAHNERFRAGLETFQRGLWSKSDLSFEEKQKLLAGSKMNASQSSQLLQASPGKMKTAPNYVNWTAAGLVYEVEDQETCGSCYAFATVGVVEGVMLRNNVTTRRLSVQQIVDCDKSNFGCGGGEPITSLKYAKKQGLTTAGSYPYTSKRGKCKLSSSPISEISSVARVTLNGNENRLKSYVASYGPVAVAINTADSFMNYVSGVYSNTKCSQKQDHAVLLVGYGTDPKFGDYWLVKNSWGTSWGELGYVRMARNKKNLCGIATTVWYAV